MNAIRRAAKAGLPLKEIVDQAEREAISEALKLNSYNQCRTARWLGVHRNTLSRKMEALHMGIKAERRKSVAKAAWLAKARTELWQLA